jgi:hypothetical protein
MSDHAVLDDDVGEFREPLNLALDGAGLEAFKWLVVGHVAYIVGLAVMVALRVENGMVWATPLFGLPLLWRSRDHRFWAKVAVLLVAFTAIHYLAVQLAVRSYQDQAALVPGLVGGAVGAVGSFAIAALFGLLRPGAATLIFAVFATVMLAAVGSMGVYLYLTTGAPNDSMLAGVVQLLKIYTPWQIAFAYALAKVLRPDG